MRTICPATKARSSPSPTGSRAIRARAGSQGKVALITGADSGIGRAVAALFAREGADIAIVYLCEHDDAAETKAIVEAEGRRAIAIAGDLGDKDFCDRAVKETVDKLGGLDILVNNAGEQHPDEDITDITEEQLKRTFQTNIFSMFFLTQAARPHLKKGAAIVNCTSVTMYQGSKELLDYSATKGAITAFTRSLSENLVGEGIRVNGVAPGPDLDPAQSLRRRAAGEDRRISASTRRWAARASPTRSRPPSCSSPARIRSYMSGQVLHPNGGTIVGS